MGRIGLALSIISLSFLTACEQDSSPVLKKSDYTGSFYTQSGNCPESAEMSINTNKGKVEVAFYCFIRACFSAKGKLSQGGFFEIRQGSKEFINGRLSTEQASGNWSLTINGHECHGRFEAERTGSY